MSNQVKRITNRTDAEQAVNNMLAEMEAMGWDGVRLASSIVTDRKMGAYVEVTVPIEDEPEATTYAFLFQKNGEYVCAADFYMGEGVAFTGTNGGQYTVNEYGDLVEAE